MSILDRLKSQPPWTDPDPLVRLDGTYEIPDDDQDLLASIARDDPDPRVRRAVIERVEIADVLGALAGSDPDADVRDAARDGLARLACRADEGGDERAAAALANLSEDRYLAQVAKTAEREVVATAALARLTESRSIAGTAKQSVHAAVRLGAVARLDVAEDLTSVAQNGEHKDSALAALERVADPEALRSIAALAKCKVAGRRAKAMLRAIESQAQVPSLEEQAHLDLERRTGLCNRLDASARFESDTRLAAELESIANDWQLVTASAGGDEALTRRFETTLAAAQQRVTDLRAAREEHARLAAARDLALAPHRALCDAAEALGDTDAPERLTQLKDAWSALETHHGTDIDALAARFEHACARHHRTLVARQTAESRHAHLDTIVTETELLVNGTDQAAAAAGWTTAASIWESTRAGLDVDPDLLARFDVLRQIMTARRTALDEARDRKRRERRARLTRKVDTLEALVGSDRLTLKTAERAVRDIRATLDVLAGAKTPSAPSETDPASLLPTKEDRDALLARYRDVQTALLPRLEELRQADDWQRWANASVQEQLSARAEALLALENLDDAVRELRHLQLEWKKVRIAPRDRSEALWQRFKTATDAVRQHCQPYLAERAEERAANTARKEAMCQQVEALADSTDWIRTADTIKKLQADWKAIGSGFNEKATWERFRAACDRFFTRRKEDLGQRKKVWSANLAAKVALCERAEALTGSTDWDAAASEIKKLQAEWKAVGPVQRSRTETLWKRFRTACDGFFERHADRDRGGREANLEAQEQICAALERLLPTSDTTEPTAAPEDLLVSVRDLRMRWQQTGAEAAGHTDVAVRFEKALRQLGDAHTATFKGTDLDLTANARRLEQLCERVERFVKKDVAVTSATSLAAQLKEALAANTIGGSVPDESRWRTMTEEVRDAQAAATRVGALPRGTGRVLNDRFRKACDAFFDQRRKQQPPPAKTERSRPIPTARRGSR